MYEANVGATQRVLDAAIAAGDPADRLRSRRSTSSATPTAGSSTRPTAAISRDGFLSYYDETKYRAHDVATEARIEAGAPIVIVQPAQRLRAERIIRGSGRSSRPRTTAQLPYIGVRGDGDLSPTYVDDVAAGIVAALDRGRIGEAYVMAGENMALRDAMRVCRRGGRAQAAAPEHPDRGPPDRVATGSARGRGIRPPARPARDRRGPRPASPSGPAAPRPRTELGYATRDLATGARDAFGPATNGTGSPPPSGSS